MSMFFPFKMNAKDTRSPTSHSWTTCSIHYSNRDPRKREVELFFLMTIEKNISFTKSAFDGNYFLSLTFKHLACQRITNYSEKGHEWLMSWRKEKPSPLLFLVITLYTSDLFSWTVAWRLNECLTVFLFGDQNSIFNPLNFLTYLSDEKVGFCLHLVVVLGLLVGLIESSQRP